MAAAGNEENLEPNHNANGNDRNENIIEIQRHLENNDFQVVYFDLETSGFGRRAEILQIAAMYGNSTFSVYIYPRYDIPQRASQVNGLTTRNNNLLLNGCVVNSVSLQTGLNQFCSFLNTAGKRCVLTAHNCNYDRSQLLNAIESVNLMEHFKDLVYGFADTLPIAKAITKTNEKGANTLTGLADSLNIPHGGAHNAINDVAVLKQVLQGLEVSEKNVIENCKSLDAIIELKRRIEELEPVQFVISDHIKTKIIGANITFEMIEKAYIDNEVAGLTILLRQVTRSNVVILKLANFLKLCSNL